MTTTNEPLLTRPDLGTRLGIGSPFCRDLVPPTLGSIMAGCRYTVGTGILAKTEQMSVPGTYYRLDAFAFRASFVAHPGGAYARTLWGCTKDGSHWVKCAKECAAGKLDVGHEKNKPLWAIVGHSHRFMAGRRGGFRRFTDGLGYIGGGVDGSAVTYRVVLTRSVAARHVVSTACSTSTFPVAITIARTLLVALNDSRLVQLIHMASRSSISTRRVHLVYVLIHFNCFHYSGTPQPRLGHISMPPIHPYDLLTQYLESGCLSRRPASIPCGGAYSFEDTHLTLVMFPPEPSRA
ncbi:hypothetical protein L210DRAFT_3632380 [Boletus edulis BED1]|uniref:Uncharacterized protein n=1 Tax=Boletus edulis BED1 TaxID=1328754 RepID=A0AAD4GBY0_BOLED|nr:hypothetical protein L210DRAFT_3632380 [Boletus edulis BED1]